MDEKIEKYIRLLHPEYDTLTLEEQSKLMKDRKLIEENIERVDRYYKGCMEPNSGAQSYGQTEQQIIMYALMIIRYEKYFSLLHPEFDKLPLYEKIGPEFDADRSIIVHNLEEIERLYEERMKRCSTTR